MSEKSIILTDDDGDEIIISIGTVVFWIDADKRCLSFTDKKKELKQFAEAILNQLNIMSNITPEMK